MPPRKKITSTRQVKAERQLKRAIKRGEAPPEALEPAKKRKDRKGPTRHTVTQPETEVARHAKKLQSAFLRLPKDFLDKTREIAANVALIRPISDDTAVYHSYERDGDASMDSLSCPKRPKWNFEMSKNEVESNEQGNYNKWLQATDDILEKWQNKGEPQTDVDMEKAPTDEVPSKEAEKAPHPPSYFERNIEVWRQLWRVTEISQIILVLLDSRCPTLHYPPSLANYLTDQKVILVLTKVDIAGPVRVEAWIKHIKAKYPNIRIVQVEAYIEKVISEDHQGRRKTEPSIPHHFREKLVQVIKEVHAELLEPPENVKSNPKWLSTWVPPVKREVDWDAVMQAKGDKVGHVVGGAMAPKPTDGSTEPSGDQVDHSTHQEPGYLTIGLIGQPNVGKSSLLNALFGAIKTRASRTAGKTRHFQTLFWTPDVRLVDCPGLVMPNFVPMEMQVLCGILPISKVSAVPACTYFASQYLPLEEIYGLTHPSTKLAPVEDKRTWRGERKLEDDTKKPPKWTAMDILTAYADSKGWVTAKAGRPDIHRAGNAMLRALSEGRIHWGFWPPDTPSSEISSANAGESYGIYIPQEAFVDESDSEAEADRPAAVGTSEESEEDEDEDEESEESEEENEESAKTGGPGRFGALLEIEDGEEDDDSSGESSD